MKKLLLILLTIWFTLCLPLLLFGQKEAIIHITTDTYPAETRWVLHSDSLNGPIIGDVNYGHYNAPNTTYTDTLYIADTITDITFVIYDSYGDGMNGSYYVSICADTIISYPTPSFNTGTYSNRTVPSCMPTGPPTGPCVPAVLNINLDQFTPETTWEIHDSTGALLYAGGPYSQAPNYQPQFENVCLPLGEITLTMYDSYGDGLAGSLWGGNDGSYYLIQCGDTLVYGDVPNFGTDTSHIFLSDTCVPPPPLPGCMDPNYLEYDYYATIDDSSCVTLKILGCTDTTMFNYDSLANAMDYVDSCMYTLTLYDYQGNGWVGSALNVYHGDDTVTYALLYGYTETFYLMLNAPEIVTVELIVDPQASGTVIECGFSLISSSGDTTIYVPGGFGPSGPLLAFFPYTGITNCGVECETIVTGCTDSTAYNYNDSANVAATCYYNPGCMYPAYLEYYTQGFVADIDDSTCSTLALFGCTDSTMYNYDTLANVSVGCVPKIFGCMQPLAFNYNVNANTSDTCIAVVYGCMSQLAINYDSLANTDDGTCIGIVYGCTDTAAFNFSPLANCDDSSCIPVIYGCINPTQFNYDSIANTNDGSCIPFIYGCTDSIMFNFNSLANADNNTCIPYIYGCTDPSMLNYNPQANTEDFSCIAYIYGCTDSTALNYDSTANTNNNSCISVVQGCMDQTAYNFNPIANTSDSLSCNYDAGCITGPGEPYWLNDLCYAWVIDVDEYCCDNEWDEICQLTYDYCNTTWTGPQPPARLTIDQINMYPNPTKGIVNFDTFIDIQVFNSLGEQIIQRNNVKSVDLSKFSKGIYHFTIKYGNKFVNYNIVKN